VSLYFASLKKLCYTEFVGDRSRIGISRVFQAGEMWGNGYNTGVEGESND
jgi:hypothetical protein